MQRLDISLVDWLIDNVASNFAILPLLSASWFSHIFDLNIIPDNVCPIFCTVSFRLHIVLLRILSNRVDSLSLFYVD